MRGPAGVLAGNIGPAGYAVAMAVAKRMVLFLRRSGNQSQFSEPLKAQQGAAQFFEL